MDFGIRGTVRRSNKANLIESESPDFGMWFGRPELWRAQLPENENRFNKLLTFLVFIRQ